MPNQNFKNQIVFQIETWYFECVCLSVCVCASLNVAMAWNDLCVYFLFDSGLYLFWWDVPLNELGYRGWHPAGEPPPLPCYNYDELSSLSPFPIILYLFPSLTFSVCCGPHTALHCWGFPDRSLSPAGRRRESLPHRSRTYHRDMHTRKCTVYSHASLY